MGIERAAAACIAARNFQLQWYEWIVAKNLHSRARSWSPPMIIPLQQPKQGIIPQGVPCADGGDERHHKLADSWAAE